MIFEELQPLIVFTFGFPHFHQRLDLKTPEFYVDYFQTMVMKLSFTIKGCIRVV